jgi:hypothetical protein
MLHFPTPIKAKPVRCQHIATREVPYSRVASHGMRLIPLPCRAQPRISGYCDFHQASVEVIAIGKTHNYPGLSVNSSLEIGAGKANWEAYAVCATTERVRQIRAAIEAQ